MPEIVQTLGGPWAGLTFQLDRSGPDRRFDAQAIGPAGGQAAFVPLLFDDPLYQPDHNAQKQCDSQSADPCDLAVMFICGRPEFCHWLSL